MRSVPAIVACCVLVGLLAGSAAAVVDASRASEVDDHTSETWDPGSTSDEWTACPSGAPSLPGVDRQVAEAYTGSPSSGGSADDPDPSSRPTADEPRIVKLVANTARSENVGEYLVVEVPTPAPANLTVTDGHATATVDTDTVSDRLALSADPDATRELTRYPVRQFEGHLRLNADGDDLAVRVEDETVDAVAYADAPESSAWYRADGTKSDSVDRSPPTPSDPASGAWWPLGATCLPALEVDPDAATAFTLPDAPEVPLETIERADDRLLIGGYTFTSDRIADALAEAAGDGVDVEVLVEASPVGGTPAATRDVLDDLDGAGATVRATGGQGSRFAYHHPKYAVVDDEVLVLTENWKPSGVGGRANRGLGVRVVDGELANAVAAVFAADAAGPDVEPWDDHRAEATFVDDETGGPPAWADGDAVDVESADGARYPTAIEPKAIDPTTVELLLAPDNAEGRLLDLLASAEESVLVTQPRIAHDPEPLAELVDAARRGVEVRILLDATWYVESENREFADALERVAADEGTDLDVRLVEPGNRFEKIHAKGVVVDEEAVVVGSINWNDNSLQDNRELALLLEGSSVGSYYASVFESDWTASEVDGDLLTLPVGLGVAVVTALAVAVLAGRRFVRFDDGERRPAAISGVGSGSHVGHPREGVPANDGIGRQAIGPGEYVDRDGVDGIVIEPAEPSDVDDRPLVRTAGESSSDARVGTNDEVENRVVDGRQLGDQSSSRD